MIREDTRFQDSTLMEGMISFRAVINGMESGVNDRRIVKVLFDEARKKALASHLSYIRAKSFQYGFPVEAVSRETIENMAIGSTHGGLLTLTSDRTLPVIDTPQKDGFYVLLNGIEDPYNFGYALRSLYAAGVDGVILDKRNWMSAAGVVCRASAGASEQIPLYVSNDDCQLVSLFQKQGYRLVCADLENSKPLREANLKKPLLLAVGGEKRGLSSELLAHADEIVRIDYGRPFRESLSAASAASILAFFVLDRNG